MHVWRDGNWELQPETTAELPQAATSRSWYEGKREHLPVAAIGSPAKV
jgi:hypothetical protein